MSSSLKSLTNARGFLLSAVVDNWRVILPVVLLLGAITAADARSIDINADNVEADESEVIRNRRIPANASPVVDYSRTSCYSDISNQTVPAAHIKGRGFQWKVEGNMYAPQWNCNGSMAYVTGGMWFKQEDKSLYVPKCGLYYISSNIAYQNNGDETESYSHTLKVDRNCDSDRNSYYQYGYATLEGSSSKTSIRIADIVKVCTGGRIYVNIPTSSNGCCPRGYEQLTSLTAYLVSETDCKWPVDTYKRPRENIQESS